MSNPFAASLARVKEKSVTYALAGATLVCALGVGYVMQYGMPFSSDAPQPQTAELDITDITPTSSASGAGAFVPADTVVETVLPPATDQQEAPVQLAAVTETLPEPDLPPVTAEPAPVCDITMTADPGAGAMVMIDIDAPCHAEERLTLHHQGLMVTQVMQDDGTLRVSVPALAEQALFIAAFASDTGATAMAEVPSLAFYDRVAVQWKGNSGLELHAREFDADYFTPGHVWAEQAGDLAAAARGESGFLTRLGDATSPDALMAEVYSFPAGTAARSGQIALSVEAEITATNCDTTVEAQTLDIRGTSGLETQNLTLDMPGCDSAGDFLVLKNLLEDLTIAAR